MAIEHPDLSQAFPVEDLLQSGLGTTGLSRSNSNTGSNGSSSSSTNEDIGQLQELENGPLLARFLSNRDLFPMVVGYLDTRSLLALTSISARFRRELLMPAIPSACCLNLFLQQRTVVCPMAQFESLKDFMVKYRSFKPLHLHFTYSEQSSLMSLLPEATAPIYNSRQDLTFAHPTTSSPHTSSPVYGVNNSISINITSSNRLYQSHHSVPPTSSSSSTSTSSSQPHPYPQLQPQQQPQPQTQLDKMHAGTTSSHAGGSSMAASSGPSANIGNTSSSSNINIGSSSDNNSSSLQYAAAHRLQEMCTSNNNCIDSANSSESSSDRKDRKTIADIESKDDGKAKSLESSDPGPRAAAMAIHSTPGIISSQPQLPSQSHHQHSNYAPIPIHHDSIHNMHGAGMNISIDMSGHSESIPVLSSSLNSTSPPFTGHGHQGFELSYWQRFALNELFMRLLPFIKTLTIGRTDKPSRRMRAQRANGELSAGVCFFLARCFNVMHDMPDTALESVLWMDVTPKDVTLLVTMIQLRDIMVDERYWRRGYWAADHPNSRDDDDQDGSGSLDGYEDDEDDWDGFYYLLNQENADNTPPKLIQSYVSAAVGKTPQRKTSSIKGFSHSKPKNNASSSSSSSSTSTSTSTTTGVSSYSPNGGLADLDENTSLFRRRTGKSPASWQGFGESTLEVNGTNSLLPEPELHSAVQLYMNVKAELADAALVARTLGKGKHLATCADPSEPWGAFDSLGTETEGFS